MLKGELKEDIYNTDLNFVKSNTFKENQLSYLDNSLGYHTINNINNDISVSLHLYSPPNYITKYYN